MRLARCSAATAAPAGRFVTAAGARGTQHGNLASPAHTLQHNCASSQRVSQTGTPLGVAGRCKRQRHNAARPGPAGAVRAQTRPDALASRDDLPPSPPSLPTPEEEATVIEEIDFLEVKEPIVEERAEGAAATVIAALVFGAGVWGVLGEQKGAEFFAGYLLEQSLSVDNLFVFILVFKYFKTPVEYQSKVLTYGIATAAVLRLVLIVVGVDIVERFEPVLLLFAAILLVSSFKLLLGSEDDEEEDLSENKIVQFVRSIVTFSDAYDGDKFFTVQNGVRVATPLLLVLLVVELSDVVFAVDSIPAVFGVTLDPFIVYSSNIFAILSLRGLYSFVSTVMKELRFLDKAVALVLGFVGGKILADFVGYHVPTDWSLGIVASILGVGVGASLLSPGTKADAE